MITKRMAAFLVPLIVMVAFAAHVPHALATEADASARFCNAKYFERGYSIYAVASELDAGRYLVTVSLQFTPFFAPDDEIASYNLVVNDAVTHPLPITAHTEDWPNGFGATIEVQGKVDSMRVIPILKAGGALLAEALTLPSASDDWDRPIGQETRVQNPNPNERLNLRVAPDLESDVWMQYYNGVPVEVHNVLPDGWIAVTIGYPMGDAQGYMKADFLAFGEDAGKVISSMPTQRAQTAFAMVDLPEPNASITANYPSGTDVTVLGLSKTWWHVMTERHTGYVRIGALEGKGDAQEEALWRPSHPIPAYYLENNLQYYLKIMTTSSGYQVHATVGEYGNAGFDVNVGLEYPADLIPNDVIIGYSLYVNGVFKAKLVPVEEETLRAPTNFYADAHIAEDIQSMHLVPILEKSGEHTDVDEFIVFDVGDH